MTAIPTQRGPRPHPDWLVTDLAAVDTELGILKTGKEADVFLLERAVPGDPEQAVVMAAKRYRGEEHRSFHRSAAYTEGRRTRARCPTAVGTLPRIGDGSASSGRGTTS